MEFATERTIDRRPGDPLEPHNIALPGTIVYCRSGRGAYLFMGSEVTRLPVEGIVAIFRAVGGDSQENRPAIRSPVPQTDKEPGQGPFAKPLGETARQLCLRPLVRQVRRRGADRLRQRTSLLQFP